MNLSERLREIIEKVTPPTRRFVALEEATQINAKTWQTWWSRKGKASADMIQAAGQAWPHYAFWLVTGIDDFNHGHTSPNHANSQNKGWPFTPERTAARDYFVKQIEYEKWMQNHPKEQEQHGDDANKARFEHSCDLHQLLELRTRQEQAIADLKQQQLLNKLSEYDTKSPRPTDFPS